MKLFSFFKTRTSSSRPPSKHLKIISNTTECDRGKSRSAAVVDSPSYCLPVAALEESVGELVETASKALKSSRLFFQPGNTSSILELQAAKYEFNNCETLDIDSEDPYWDFHNSMEEMVEAYGIKRWEHLEELLALYLRMNMKKNHGVIVGAFIDIFATISSTSSNCYASSSSKNHRVVRDKR
ncbi:hypothetical protein Q3G72_002758 [Acer saccharum]|nr:hypothetical protein Q3G72_002758 [Acer saccharum]